MRRTPTLITVGLLCVASLAGAGCGEGGSGSTPDADVTNTAEPALPDDTTTSTDAASTTDAPATTASPDTTAPVADESWRQRADEFCGHFLAIFDIPEPGPDQASLEAYVQAHRAVYDAAPDVAAIDVPTGPGRASSELEAVLRAAGVALQRAAVGAAATDIEGMWDGIETYEAHLGYLASALAAAGQSCGPADAARAANASLNVSVVGPWQVDVGFDSVWVSQFRSDSVVRIDPETGAVLATMDMPSRPFKLQPADGRMHVRTADSYVAIDPTTNAVIATLPMSDVGPNAGRSWAVDGALWICDGDRLHRYDPGSLELLATVRLDLECGQVYATPDVAIAWTYNETPGESGDSRAAFVDPSTDAVLATVALAADAGVPVVLDGAAFFPPQGGSLASVVDLVDLTVVAPSDLGRFVDGGSQPAFDGTHIYVIADKPSGTILVIDPTSYDVTGVIGALATAPSLNALAASPGVLWAANNSGGILQRFDTGG